MFISHPNQTLSPLILIHHFIHSLSDLHGAFRALFAIFVPGYFTIDDIVDKFLGHRDDESVELKKIYDSFYAGDAIELQARPSLPPHPFSSV